MNTEKVYLIKRRSSGIYYLSITHYDSGKRKLSRISCKTKSKAEALKFFKNYKNEKVEKPDEHTLTIEEAINIVISYSETNLRPNTTLRFKMVFKIA